MLEVLSNCIPDSGTYRRKCARKFIADSSRKRGTERKIFWLGQRRDISQGSKSTSKTLEQGVAIEPVPVYRKRANRH